MNVCVSNKSLTKRNSHWAKQRHIAVREIYGNTLPEPINSGITSSPHKIHIQLARKYIYICIEIIKRRTYLLMCVVYISGSLDTCRVCSWCCVFAYKRYIMMMWLLSCRRCELYFCDLFAFYSNSFHEQFCEHIYCLCNTEEEEKKRKVFFLF